MSNHCNFWLTRASKGRIWIAWYSWWRWRQNFIICRTKSRASMKISNLLLPASKNAGETFKFAQLPTATGRSKRRNVDLRTRHPTQSGRRPEPPPQSWEKNFRDARNQLVIAATSESTMSHNRNSRSQILPEVQLVVEKSEEIRIFHKIFKFSTRTLIKFGSKDLSSTLKESDVRVSANLFF